MIDNNELTQRLYMSLYLLENALQACPTDRETERDLKLVINKLGDTIRILEKQKELDKKSYLFTHA